MTALNGLNYLKATKNLIKNAIINKGVEVADTDTFRSYPEKISQISGGVTPTGTIDITENGTVDVTDYATANVNVESTTTSWNILFGTSTIAAQTTGELKYAGPDIFFLPEIDISDNKPWEIYLKVNNAYSSSGGTWCSLINDRVHWGSIGIYLYNDNTIGYSFGNGSSAWLINEINLLSRPTTGDWFYIKYYYDGDTSYILEVYDENKTLTGSYTGTVSTSATKSSTMNIRLLDHWDSSVDINRPTSSIIDLSESYIKVDGEYVQGGES